MAFLCSAREIEFARDGQEIADLVHLHGNGALLSGMAKIKCAVAGLSSLLITSTAPSVL